MPTREREPYLSDKRAYLLANTDLSFVLAPSEPELKGSLYKTGRHGTRNLPERGIVDVAIHGIGPEELRMIEGIKRFHAKFEPLGFRESP